MRCSVTIVRHQITMVLCDTSSFKQYVTASSHVPIRFWHQCLLLTLVTCLYLALHIICKCKTMDAALNFIIWRNSQESFRTEILCLLSRNWNPMRYINHSLLKHVNKHCFCNLVNKLSILKCSFVLLPALSIRKIYNCNPIDSKEVAYAVH